MTGVFKGLNSCRAARALIGRQTKMLAADWPQFKLRHCDFAGNSQNIPEETKVHRKRKIKNSLTKSVKIPNILGKMDDVKSNQDVFSGDKYAENYRKGRPGHPKSLVDAILKFLRVKVQLLKIQVIFVLCLLLFVQFLGTLELEVAVDVGCGPGESVEILQSYFAKIIGLDNSQSMVDNAKQNNSFANVEYLQVSKIPGVPTSPNIFKVLLFLTTM